jgi:hypothetical protein
MITDNNNNLNHVKCEPMFYHQYYYNSQPFVSATAAAPSASFASTAYQQENFMDTSSNSSLCSFSSNGCHETTAVAQPRTANRGGRKQVKVGTNKRNARERNRVRYINNCFELLREHIPMELVASVGLESPAMSSRNQKLSKVETLKLATLYIKQLTELLMTGEDGDCENDELDDDKDLIADRDQIQEFMPCKSLKTGHHRNHIDNFAHDNHAAVVGTSNSPPAGSASPSSTSSSSTYHSSSSSASSQYSLSPKYFNYEQPQLNSHFNHLVNPATFCNQEPCFQGSVSSYNHTRPGFAFSTCCFQASSNSFNFNGFC